jgi:hypothetical protein
MSIAKKPPPPRGLKAPGKRLWQATVDGFILATHEEALLLQACRVADHLDELEKALSANGVLTQASFEDCKVHPALVELRQQAITLARLCAALGLPSGLESDSKRPQRRSARGVYRLRPVDTA